MNKDEEEFVDNLIRLGAVEFIGFDKDTGEPLYVITEKLGEIDPDLRDKIANSFHREMMDLWEKGFLDMDVTTANPLVRITEKAFDPNEVAKLDENQKINLNQIILKMMQ